MTRKVQFCDVSLRDGQQSLAATRMTTEQCLRVLPFLNDAGYANLELWGGATLDSCVRFLNEDPWERLETFKKVLGSDQKIKALLRGQNLFGYQPYPDDLVISFIKQAVQSGVHNMRIFDALNDERNLKIPILASKAYGAVVEAVVCYTTSPVHTPQYFVDFAIKMMQDGADRICIKDMAALLHPLAAIPLFKELRAKSPLPLVLHGHCTTGVGVLNAVLAMKYGIDMIDTAITPFAGGPSHPPIELMIPFAEEMGIEHGLNKDMIRQAQSQLFVIYDELIDNIPYKHKYFQPVDPDQVDRKKIAQILNLLEDESESSVLEALRLTREIEREFNYPEFDDRLFESQIPGGMLTNLQKQLGEMGMSERLDEVMAEIPIVRKDVGYVPLVTPTSQIVGSQAAFNVITGERYGFLSNEMKMLLRGEFGKTPAECNPDLVKRALSGGEEPLKYRPAFYLPPVLEKTYDLPYVKTSKDLLLHLMFGKSAEKFLVDSYQKTSRNN